MGETSMLLLVFLLFFLACNSVHCLSLPPELRLMLLLNPPVLEYPPPLVPVTASQQIIHDKIVSSWEQSDLLPEFSFVFSYISRALCFKCSGRT